MADEESIIDLVQGHTTGSPDAVCCAASIGHATDERRVAGQVVRSERVAGWQPRLLRSRSGCS